MLALHSTLCLNNIPFHGYTTFFNPLICSVDGHLSCLYCLGIMNNAIINISVESLFVFLLGRYLRVGLLDYMVTLVLTF